MNSIDHYPTATRLNKMRAAWWRHQMETFPALLAICVGNSPVTCEFPAQRPVTQSFDVLFDLRLNKRLSKQSRGWWFETPSHPLWRHSNGVHIPWDVLRQYLMHCLWGIICIQRWGLRHKYTLGFLRVYMSSLDLIVLACLSEKLRNYLEYTGVT